MCFRFRKLSSSPSGWRTCAISASRHEFLPVSTPATRLGNLGDVKTVGGGVSEMRIDVGSGYRVYFTRRKQIVIVLLCGGDKSTQSKDIATAQRMAGLIE